jgi:hypothetical protein
MAIGKPKINNKLNSSKMRKKRRSICSSLTIWLPLKGLIRNFPQRSITVTLGKYSKIHREELG